MFRYAARRVNYRRQRGLGYTAADLAITTDPAMLAKLTLQEQINAGTISEVDATAAAGGPINPCGNPAWAAAHPNYPNFNADPASCNKTPGPLQVGQVLTPPAPAPTSTAPPATGGGSSAPPPSSFGTWLSTLSGPAANISLPSIPWWGWALGVGGLGWLFFGRSK